MCEYTAKHLRKLIEVYRLDIALIKDGYQPASLFVAIWCRDLSRDETLTFLMERIATCVARLIDLETR
jgi:hypothetical protein